MTIGIEISDLIRDENGCVTLPQPQTRADVLAAVTTALDAVKAAYRVAYTATDGDLADDTVDTLDLAANVLLAASSEAIGMTDYNPTTTQLPCPRRATEANGTVHAARFAGRNSFTTACAVYPAPAAVRLDASSAQPVTCPSCVEATR